MVLQDLKVGSKFQMEGLTVSGKRILSLCELISYNGMNKYIVESDGCMLLLDGDSKVYNVVNK
jgi:hypothetical protein